LRLLLLAIASISSATLPAATLEQTIRTAQIKVVKIYGAGGLRQLEAYQSGILISAEGHVLTALSYVLDTDDLAIVLDDGRKWQAELVGSDPVSELAVLKLASDADTFPYFDLQAAARAGVGQRVLALSNLYGIASGDEPVSVLQGVISAVAPLEARRGAFQVNFRGTVYVLDAYANNPGAAGGALVDWQGQLLGVLGKELRSQVTGTWLNYALPVESFAATVDDLIAGRVLQSASTDRLEPDQPLTAEVLGIALVPNILPRTPPYVDTVRRGSPADRVGLRSDDLIVFIAAQPTPSCQVVLEEFARHEQSAAVSISVLRDGSLLEFSLLADADSPHSVSQPIDQP